MINILESIDLLNDSSHIMDDDAHELLSGFSFDSGFMCLSCRFSFSVFFCLGELLIMSFMFIESKESKTCSVSDGFPEFVVSFPLADK